MFEVIEKQKQNKKRLQKMWIQHHTTSPGNASNIFSLCCMMLDLNVELAYPGVCKHGFDITT